MGYGRLDLPGTLFYCISYPQIWHFVIQSHNDSSIEMLYNYR